MRRAALLCPAAVMLCFSAVIPVRAQHEKSIVRGVDKEWTWSGQAEEYMARRQEGEAEKFEFQARGSDEKKRFIVKMEKEHLAPFKQWLAKSKYADEVLFLDRKPEDEYPPRDKLLVWIGNSIPVDMARAVARIVMQDRAPDEVAFQTWGTKIFSSQIIATRRMARHAGRPATKELVATLLDPKTSAGDFVKAVRRHEMGPEYKLPPTAPDGLLARYTFKDGVDDVVGKTGPWRLHNVPRVDGMLFVNGVFLGRFVSAGAKGYLATTPLPGLNLKSLTCTVVFYPVTWKTVNNIITFDDRQTGWVYAWFSIFRHEKGHLVAYPKGLGHIEFPGRTVAPKQWHVMTCGYDMDKRKIRMFIDGARVGEKDLPPDGTLSALLMPNPQLFQSVALMQRHNAGTFHGMIDEIVIHNGYVADELILKLHKAYDVGRKAAPSAALKQMRERKLAVEKKETGQGFSLCTEEMLRKARIGSGKWELKGRWLYPADVTKPGQYNLGGMIYFPIRAQNSEITGFMHIPDDAPKGHIRIHWNSSWKKGDSHFSYTPGTGAVTFGKWGDPRNMKRLKVGPQANPVPFCIRVRDRQGVLFLGKGDKPVARASGMDADEIWLVLNMRNFGKAPVRFGHVEVRFYDPKEPLDKPIPAALFMPPEMPAFDSSPAAPLQ